MTLQAKRKLVLVRHSLPEIVPGVPASQWHLSNEGRQRCTQLAERLSTYSLDLIVASQEPKAIETGQIVADILGIPGETAAGLHEHARHNVEFSFDRRQFQAKVAGVFEHPRKRVFGNESADEAHSRFAQAIANVLGKHCDRNLAVVSHGTVMALFVARATGLDPIRFWKRLGLPSFAVLSLPDYDLLETIARVAPES
jgi:broad specificity phosphatase PhoE